MSVDPTAPHLPTPVTKVGEFHLSAGATKWQGISKYFARSMVDGSPAADSMFDEMVDFTDQRLVAHHDGRMRDPGRTRPCWPRWTSAGGLDCRRAAAAARSASRRLRARSSASVPAVCSAGPPEALLWVAGFRRRAHCCSSCACAPCWALTGLALWRDRSRCPAARCRCSGSFSPPLCAGIGRVRIRPGGRAAG